MFLVISGPEELFDSSVLGPVEWGPMHVELIDAFQVATKSGWATRGGGWRRDTVRPSLLRWEDPGNP